MMKQKRECDRYDIGYPVRVLMIDSPKNTEATKQIRKSYNYAHVRGVLFARDFITL